MRFAQKSKPCSGFGLVFKALNNVQNVKIVLSFQYDVYEDYCALSELIVPAVYVHVIGDNGVEIGPIFNCDKSSEQDPCIWRAQQAWITLKGIIFILSSQPGSYTDSNILHRKVKSL